MNDEHNSCSFVFRMIVLLLLERISELPSAIEICCSFNDDDDDDLRYVCEYRCKSELCMYGMYANVNVQKKCSSQNEKTLRIFFFFFFFSSVVVVKHLKEKKESR